MKKIVILFVSVLMLVVSVNSSIAGQKTTAAQPVSASVEQAVVQQININTADDAALMSLPGIGETTAKRISDYRSAHGPFKSVDELLNVKGIGPKVLEKIKPFLVIS